ncbi:hypothetical protein DFA_01718 [Cavenderia fasciculata]|uniref:Type A von Willebrand factor domain-containing protein n=1 Tax=Cavenderia fasciculata TaxID=261658 RepID=F4PUB7_CACFS|nr:uncharacterized protein DFA_01718 [Cavenderia fasciculata]EGG21832.1 hypothetical protein DFA_01718 [Cavenderia fasciculata]|eukprot:XP_004359682.1 hypothetical protein DFA_01718 [Cavenderia fasciculata]
MKKIISFFSSTSSTSVSSTSSSSSPSSKSGTSSSGSTVASSDEQRNDYENANYFNYYRYIEKESKGGDRAKSGLQCKRVIQQPNTIQSTINQNKFNLTSVEINSVLTDTCSVSTFKKHFVNNYDSPVEAFYQLPLPPQASVNGFTVEFDGQVLHGVIKEKEEAFQAYTDAIASGGQAFLGEKSADGYFSMSIGNLPPKKDVSITLNIISELGTHYDSLHFCLHRFLFPDYSFDFKAKLTINLSSPIQQVEVLNKEYQKQSTLTFSEDKKTATFSTHLPQGLPNNYVVVIVPHATPEPKAMIEYIEKDKSHAVALSFYPSYILDKTPEDELNQKMECIFIVDRSGSMSGDRIQSSKSALQIIMRSLNENTKFNIVSFGTSFEKLFPESRDYDDTSLTEASKLIEGMSANMGGTELFEPIKDVLKAPALPDYPRQVFILTDGAVSQRQQLVKFVASEANTTRIFTFGIGGGVDKELVIGLSKACKGSYELISDSANDFEERVLSLLSIAMQPMLSNVKIDWEGAGLTGVIQAPQDIRPVYSREHMIVYALIDDKEGKNNDTITKQGSVTVNLTGNGPTGTILTFPITVNFSDHAVNDKELLHSLAAYQHIQDLESLETKKYENHKDKIVQLGKRFTLVSKHTSFIVTAESDTPTVDTMEQVNVLDKLQATEGRTLESLAHFSDTMTPISCSEPLQLERCSAPSRSKSVHSSQSQPMEKKRQSSSGRRGDISSASKIDINPLIELLSQQKANGTWNHSTLIEGFFFPSHEPAQGEDKDIHSTIFVIALIQYKFADRKAKWTMVVNKALRWLKQQPCFVKDPSDLTKRLEAASRLVTKMYS